MNPLRQATGKTDRGAPHPRGTAVTVTSLESGIFDFRSVFLIIKTCSACLDL